MKKVTLLVLLLLIITSCHENEDQTIVQKIAEANGIQNFEDVKELRYTFNVRVDDTLRTSRAWTWRPQVKTATLTTPDSTASYNYETEASQHEAVDQRFINDQYWLLFPFHLVWDEMEWEHTEQATAPISGEEMQRVTVKYPDGAGYTPGDMYEVYFGNDYMIQEWVYLSGGSRENPLATTWEDYDVFEGIAIAKMHRSEDGSFELFFTDVEVVTE
ncbi:hypothetical protein [Salinimicrobium sp. TH3]|uniref:hypothetical protein n=1 Tax=Salinimicrobium sp. TH3 TaxID=2997342 RepID=UPI0022769FE9|nr:hypothetical protein [Salinimicrobium sp. TH3]MCY2687817.1 hypothetical protein [Salinimicrobium sp. TH3]